MLRVTLILVPGGDEDRARVLDTVDIVNMSGLDVEVADYVVNDRWRIAHRREYGARVLAAKALMSVHTHTHDHIVLSPALTDPDVGHQLAFGEISDE